MSDIEHSFSRQPAVAGEGVCRPSSARQMQEQLLRFGNRTLSRAVGHAEAPLWLEDTLYRGDRYEFHKASGATKRPRPANLVICEPVPRDQTKRS